VAVTLVFLGPLVYLRVIVNLPPSLKTLPKPPKPPHRPQSLYLVNPDKSLSSKQYHRRA
jgi:hypothetical protein